MADIKPGSNVNIKVVKKPTNQAAVKTIVRLLFKTEAGKAEDKRQSALRIKHYTPGRRGGRLYSGHMPKITAFKADVGEGGVVRATPDVLRDLGSVKRFVEVTPA